MAGRQCQRPQVLRLHPTQPRGPAEMPPCASSASVIVGLMAMVLGKARLHALLHCSTQRPDGHTAGLLHKLHTFRLSSCRSFAFQVFLGGPRRASPVLSAAVSSSPAQPILHPDDNVTFGCAPSRTLRSLTKWSTAALQIRLVLTLSPPSLRGATIHCGSVVKDIHMTYSQCVLDLRSRVL
jgi:hypothetical protein